MVLRVGAGTLLSSFYIWQAIDYARLNGARVINMSFVGGYHVSIERAVQDASAAGLVMAAGAGQDNSNTLKYPAAYPEVLAVNGTKLDDTKQDGSPWGMVVDVSAPGDHIWTTVPGGGYVSSPGGTPSLATAHVSGVAGLVFSLLGASAPADQVYATVKYSTDYITGSPSSFVDHWGFVGTGRINSFNALQLAQSTLVVPDEYATIAAAMSAATAGQTVYVRPGTYSEDVSMKAGVRLVASRSDVTTIAGTVRFINDDDAELAGFTVDDFIGVYISSSSGVVVRNCRITNASWGFLIYSSKPTLRHNEIVDNSVGIYLGSNAGTGVVAQNSRIDGNFKGLYVRSTPTLYSKHNSIKNSTLYDLQATAGSGVIVALRNWWGEDPPDPAEISTVNSIYYYSHLTSDPIPSAHTPAKVAAREAPERKRARGDRAEVVELYREGRRALDDGEEEKATALFGSLIAQHPEARLAAVALKELVGAYAASDRADVARRHLQALYERGPESLLGRTARRLKFDLLLLERRYEDALEMATQLQRDMEGDEGEELAFESARIRRFELGRKQEGAGALREYLKRFPQADRDLRSVRRGLAHAMLGETPEAQVIAAKKANTMAPAQLELEGANPFNPETAIAFELSKTAVVDLRVYNIAGQVVRLLVSGEERGPGRHRLIWDGTDDHGRALASGVYLVRMEAGARASVRKLTLVR